MLPKLFLLLSTLGNVLFFGGDPDESLSARAWRQRNSGWGRARERIDAWLARFGPDHCQRVHNAQIGRENARRIMTK